MLTVLLELRSKDTIQGHCWSGVLFFSRCFFFSSFFSIVLTSLLVTVF
uniref:Uncharacterized protein n=1 Tax=Anguilla anguilla TaxID=7936 RepID=A0A0E9R887_ANGAN